MSKNSSKKADEKEKDEVFQMKRKRTKSDKKKRWKDSNFLHRENAKKRNFYVKRKISSHNVQEKDEPLMTVSEEEVSINGQKLPKSNSPVTKKILSAQLGG